MKMTKLSDWCLDFLYATINHRLYYQSTNLRISIESSKTNITILINNFEQNATLYKQIR